MASANVHEVNDANFDKNVLGSDKPFLARDTARAEESVAAAPAAH